jgi:hypothetical protein
MHKNKIEKMIEASAGIGFQGRFRNLSLPATPSL